ncbi:MAG TPA: helix-turn-helix domain-containing protein [Pyrinomonadaceae bacterium]|nr:helix-turn-helix domain-containing protein [Pyrinomonadaceae bacterium]
MSSSIHNLDTLREAAITLLREVETLASQQEPPPVRLGLQEEVQRYESELIREALMRTRGNQRRAAKLLGVKVTTLNCKIKRLGIRDGFLTTDYTDVLNKSA